LTLPDGELGEVAIGDCALARLGDLAALTGTSGPLLRGDGALGELGELVVLGELGELVELGMFGELGELGELGWLGEPAARGESPGPGKSGQHGPGDTGEPATFGKARELVEATDVAALACVGDLVALAPYPLLRGDGDASSKRIPACCSSAGGFEGDFTVDGSGDEYARASACACACTGDAPGDGDGDGDGTESYSPGESELAAGGLASCGNVSRTPGSLDLGEGERVECWLGDVAMFCAGDLVE
jgi:hypothetical protein